MESKIEFEENDSKLVMFVNEGNDDAKTQLYRKYSALIHKEVNRVKKKAFMYGIEYTDLCQEAMVAFSHAMNTYSDEEGVKFSTFATTCLRRKLSNFIEKLETDKNREGLNMVALDSNFINKDTSMIDQMEEIISNEPLKKLINDETLGEVNKRINNKLNVKEKMVIHYTVEGKSIQEIAEVMNLTNKQVYNLIYKARTKLK